MYGQWSECSVTCGGGTRHRTAVCVDSESNTLDDEKCSAIVPKKTQICQAETCPIWKTGDWTEVEIYQFKYSKMCIVYSCTIMEHQITIYNSFFTASVTLHAARESNSDHTGARLNTGLSKDAIVPMKVFLSIYKFAILAHVLLGFLALGQRYVNQPIGIIYNLKLGSI